MPNVYRTQDSGGADTPDYVIFDGRFYRTVHHPDGWSDRFDEHGCLLPDACIWTGSLMSAIRMVEARESGDLRS